MPTTQTITAFNEFSAGNEIQSSPVNYNFSLMRGHRYPIDGSTTAFADNSYDLGASNARWRVGYFGSLVVDSPPADTNKSNNIGNLGLDFTVASSALTIHLKQSDGATDPTSTAAVTASFRSLTTITGGYNKRSITTALTITIPSTATMGHRANQKEPVFVYLLDDGTNQRLGVSTVNTHDEGKTKTTTLNDTSADSRKELYAETATAHAVRLVGRIFSTQATPGTWATKPAEVHIGNGFDKVVYAGYKTSAGQSIDNNAVEVVNFGEAIDTGINYDSHDAGATGAAWVWTCPTGCGGLFQINTSIKLASTGAFGGAEYAQVRVNKNSSVTASTLSEYPDCTTRNMAPHLNGVRLLYLAAGDTFNVSCFQNSGSNLPLDADPLTNFVEIRRLCGI